MKKRSFIISALLLTVCASPPANGQKPESGGSIVARISYEQCHDSGDIAVPVNRGYGAGRRRVTDDIPRCGFSYSMFAVRRGRKQARLHVTAIIFSWSFDREVVLIRGGRVEMEVTRGVKVVASY